MRKFLSIVAISGLLLASDDVYVCGIFDGALNAKGNLNIGGLLIENTNEYKAASVNRNGTVVCEVNGVETSCVLKSAPKNSYSPNFRESTKTQPIPSDLVFTGDNYVDGAFNDSGITLTFNPSSNEMSLGGFRFNGSNITLNFQKGGDYYFDELTFSNGSITFKMPENENIRIFVKGNLNFNSGDVNISGDSNRIFIYSGGDISLNLNSGQKANLNGFFYAKGNINIHSNTASSDAILNGALSANGDISIDNFTINYPGEPDVLGYGKCPLCYALNNGQWVSKISFFNSNITFNFPRVMGIINNSRETLKDVKVSQIEVNPSWLSITTPEKYAVVDENGNVYPTYIASTITYSTSFGSYSHTTPSNNGEVIRWAPAVNIMGLLNSEINTTAYYGDYPSGGYEDYLAIKTYGISGSFHGGENLDYYATYYDSLGRAYKVELDYCDISNNNDNQVEDFSGPFNVVETSFNSLMDPIDNSHSLNQIYTKVVHNLFDMKVIHLANDYQTLLPYKGIVEVDIINNPTTNYQCSNNKSLWHQFVEFNDKEAYLRDVNLSFANKNVRFRVRYLTDKNGKIYNLFDKSYFSIKKLLAQISLDRYGNICPESNNEFCGVRCAVECDYKRNPEYKSGNVPEECLSCLFENYSQSSCSRDNFAVRPYGFRAFGTNQYKKAGEPFNIEIKAVDENDYNLTTGTVLDVDGVRDYNVSVGDLNVSASFYVPTDDEVKQMYKDVFYQEPTDISAARAKVAYCPNSGVFTTDTSKNFENGDVNATFTYNESGILTLKISEKAGYEFAKVDEDDTPDAQRFIKPAEFLSDREDLNKTDLLVFIPYQFETTGSGSTTTGANWLYMSNEPLNAHNEFRLPLMAEKISYVVKAEDKNGNVLRNYTATCFPDVSVNAPRRNGLKLNTTFDLFLDSTMRADRDVVAQFDVVANNTTLWLYKGEYNLTSSKVNTREWLSPLAFNEGVANADVYMNIGKKYNTPMVPVNVEVVDINTSTSWMDRPDGTNVFKGTAINKSVEFRYGLVKIPDVTSTSNEAKVKARYLYFNNDESWVVNSEHTSDVFGSISKDSTKFISVPKVNISSIGDVNNATQIVVFTPAKGVAYSAKVHYPISPWLWYNPLAKDYKAPNSTNLDCLTHPCNSVSFLGNGGGWAGVGKESQKYSEQNKTIKAPATKAGGNVNEFNRVNW